LRRLARLAWALAGRLPWFAFLTLWCGLAICFAPYRQVNCVGLHDLSPKVTNYGRAGEGGPVRVACVRQIGQGEPVLRAVRTEMEDRKMGDRKMDFV
jgi:hypothetical protein